MISGRMPWMYRTHADYDPNQLGAITEGKVALALMEAGFIVLRPYIQVVRYDLVIEDETGKLSRVQCKTGQLARGAVYFRPCSLRAAKRETGWQRVRADYKGVIDYFGIYCPDNDKVYLAPIADIDAVGHCALRIEPPKNNQQKRIRWAKDYELIPRRLNFKLDDLVE